ncbi:Hydroxysteroid (17-beta) dehydrogenase 12 [Trichostrongylus colubriformis]|uniref:Hydroxysteroid (17-beta) dehydrogenase 12 n=1 Tax=Trichostrongylus colubriformis TaxID=6319 RepID=A0AAN8GC91_TRICO
MLDLVWRCLYYCVTSYLVVRLLKCLYVFSKSFIIHVLTPIYNLDHLKDSWTVVTGGTDGIGRAYIEELAKTRGIRKFYLIGRNETKLNAVVKDMTERYGAICKTAVFDFESTNYENLPEEELKNMDVGILINCAGIAPNKVGNFMELEEGLASKILQVNVMSNIKMTELILPGMIKRNRGCVVNVSSMTGWRPVPYISTYPASKATISFFSSALSDEFRHTNVRIQVKNYSCQV